MNTTTPYKKKQKGRFLTIILIVIPLCLLYFSYAKTGSKPLPIFVAIIISILFFSLAIIFYQLCITIDNEKITASFGIGFPKRIMLLKDIDLNTIEKTTSNLRTGIGIRITSKGWLWNVKFGDAIYFQNKNKTQTFLVGTDDFETIHEILKNKHYEL